MIEDRLQRSFFLITSTTNEVILLMWITSKCLHYFRALRKPQETIEMEKSHQLSLSTKEYKMLIKLVASGQFIINAPYAPDEEDYDNEIFEFSEKLITESYEKAPDLDIDEIILETMDCVNEGFLIQFAFELATIDCIDKGYDADKLLENNESSAYHTHRHNHYIELFSLRGLDAIGVIEP